jgi:hypothetical protein
LSLCTNKLIPTLSRFRFVRRKREEIKYRRICPKLFWPPKIEYCFWLGLELAKTLGHVCLSIWLCVNLSVCLSVCQSLFFFVSAYKFINASLSVCTIVCVLVCWIVCWIAFLFACASVWLYPLCLFTCLSVCRFNFLFVVLSVWPFLPIGI